MKGFVKLALPTLLITSACAQDPAAMAWRPGQKQLHVYITNGDNLSVPEWPPLDSRSTIAAQFERLAKTYKVSRIYWRGEALRLRTDDFLIRKDNPLFYDLWMWTKHLIDNVKINEIAVQEAKKNGMEIWMSEGIFDHGAPADTGGTSVFPYQLQSRLAFEHPEWVSVDRWGERANSGTLEFAYPEARKALINEYVRLASTFGYDGMYVYTYVENYGATYPEEYGFNEPIMQEFKRRYGVDIRTQPFDKEKWYALRGEYVSTFLKELKSALNAKGKKLSVGLFPPDPGSAPPWPLTSKNPRGQQAKMDWKTWVGQGYVDELSTWYGGDPRTLLPQMKSAAGNRSVPIRMFVGSPFNPAYKPTIDAGFIPTPSLMPGSSLDRYTFDSASSTSNSWMSRAQWALDAKAGGSAGELAKLVSDPHVIVRREALMSLGALKADAQANVIEGALDDPEVSVRIAAALALATANDEDSVSKLLASVNANTMFLEKEAVLKALKALRTSALPQIYSALKSPTQNVREVAARALELETSVATTQALADAALNDSSSRVQAFAAKGVTNRRNGNAYQTMIRLLDDPDPLVQMTTADAVDSWAQGTSPQQQDQMLDKLEAIFKEFGASSTRRDRDWGWRVVGQSMLAFASGRSRVERFLGSQDKFLAWQAYEVLYHPISPQRDSNTTEAQAVSNHKSFAPPFPGRRWVSG